MAAAPWPRDRWLDAIWDDETLTPNERVVAYAYARFAGSESVSWCTWDELRRRTGIRSRDALNRAVRGLVEKGCLVLVEKQRQHYSPRYRLARPTGSQGSAKRTAESGPGVRETTPGVRQTAPRGPFNGPDYSEITQTHHSARERVDAAAVAEDLRGRTRREITNDHVQSVIREILERAGPAVKDPNRYVLAAIDREPQRYLPTPQPPPFRRDEGDPAA